MDKMCYGFHYKKISVVLDFHYLKKISSKIKIKKIKIPSKIPKIKKYLIHVHKYGIKNDIHGLFDYFHLAHRLFSLPLLCW